MKDSSDLPVILHLDISKAEGEDRRSLTYTSSWCIDPISITAKGQLRKIVGQGAMIRIASHHEL